MNENNSEQFDHYQQLEIDRDNNLTQKRSELDELMEIKSLEQDQYWENAVYSIEYEYASREIHYDWWSF